MLDANLLLRDGTANLTATGQGAAVDLGDGGQVQEFTYAVVVPQAAGTSPTLDLVIETSEASGFGTIQDKFTLPQITAKGVYFITFRTPHRYIRYNATVAGTSPNFGGVVIGPEMAGEYTEF